MGNADKNSAHVRLLLGVYVLGGLSEHEEYSVRTHLSRCAQCRAEYDELAGVPALLDLIAEDKTAGSVDDLIVDDLIDVVENDGKRGAEAGERGGNMDPPGETGKDGHRIAGRSRRAAAGVDGPVAGRSRGAAAGVDGPVAGRSRGAAAGVDGPVAGRSRGAAAGVDGPVAGRLGVPVEDPPDQLAAARRAARRARLVAALAGIAIVAAAVAGWAIGTRPASGPDAPATSGVHAYAWSRATGVSASVVLDAAPWGTKIQLMLSHLPKNQHCTLIALARGGAREPAASWQDTSQTADVPGAVSFRPDQVSRLDVVTAAGRTLVSVRVS